MLPAFIITFREILEIALILSVIAAATKGLKQQKRWIWSGIFLGLIGSSIIAIFAKNISDFASGIGMELFNASILICATLIICWTAIWMRVHARKVFSNIKKQTTKVIDGDLPKHTITLIIALAVLREGAEIIIFLYSMIASGQEAHLLILGALGGVGVGSTLGLLLYLGIISIPTKLIFKVTTILLFLIASGMAATSAKFLVAAGYFGSLSNTLWDTSNILSDKSITGQIMHVLLGYSSNPMAIQLIFYCSTLVFCTSMIQYATYRSNIKQS